MHIATSKCVNHQIKHTDAQVKLLYTSIKDRRVQSI